MVHSLVVTVEDFVVVSVVDSEEDTDKDFNVDMAEDFRGNGRDPNGTTHHSKVFNNITVDQRRSSTHQQDQCNSTTQHHNNINSRMDQQKTAKDHRRKQVYMSNRYFKFNKFERTT